MNFKAVVDEHGTCRHPDGRRACPVVCPACGDEAVACASLMMQSGINSGCGSCVKCKLFLHLAIVPDLDGDRMEVIPHAEFIEQLRREDEEAKS